MVVGSIMKAVTILLNTVLSFHSYATIAYAVSDEKYTLSITDEKVTIAERMNGPTM